MKTRTTIHINDGLMREAKRLSGLKQKTAVVDAGLQALIQREAARRLAELGGSMPNLEPIQRRRSRKRRPA